MVARWAHNPKVVSSSLASATSKDWFDIFSSQFFFYVYRSSTVEAPHGRRREGGGLKLLEIGLNTFATGCRGCGAVDFSVIGKPGSLAIKLPGFR